MSVQGAPLHGGAQKTGAGEPPKPRGLRSVPAVPPEDIRTRRPGEKKEGHTVLTGSGVVTLLVHKPLVHKLVHKPLVHKPHIVQLGAGIIFRILLLKKLHFLLKT